MRRVLYVIACLAPAWALITVVSDGIVLRAGPIRIASTEPFRPAVVGLVAALWYLWRYSRAEIDADAAWSQLWLKRVANMATPLVVLLGFVSGVRYGTFAAAGADAYGYVSQAAMWLAGDLRLEQPIVQQVSWPDAAWTFTPLGYRPVSELGAIVPTYPSGLPMIMAVFQALFGANGPFYVVPVFASVALACTYALGIVASGSAMVGSLAALLLLASPPFLAHAMVPMSDVPATAGWTLACVLAMRAPLPRSLLSGLAAGTSLLIRPNLVLLAAAPVMGWFFASYGSRDRLRIALNHTVMFALGMLPGLTAVAMINAAMYGSPFESGYGRVNDLFSLAAAPQNLRNYTSWLLETQTVLVGLAIIPLVAPRALRSSNGHSSARAVLVAVPVLVLVSYLFYAPFENWTYLRFLLPAYPAMFVLMAAGVRRISVSMPAAARAPAALFLATCCVSLSYQFARDQFVFNWRDHEQRYVHAGKRAAELTPTQAVLFASQHSGSLRYYADRMTLRYDLLQKDRLDSAVRELRAMGRPSFLVIDDWEREEFQNRFAGEHHVLAVERRPLARLPGPPDVLIFDLTIPPQ